jgi:hypothetical protein
MAIAEPIKVVIPDLPAPAQAGDPGSMNTVAAGFPRTVFMDPETSSG